MTNILANSEKILKEEKVIILEHKKDFQVNDQASDGV